MHFMINSRKFLVNHMKNDKIAYAAAFCSFLIERLENIRSVILFGSVSRGDSDKESDIDIFIDAPSGNTSRANRVLDEFYKSKINELWRLKGIKNPISLIVGDMENKEWADLKRSIISDGIVLLGKYKSEPEKLRHYTLFSYTNVKDAKKRVSLHRKLFGYKVGSKHYDGIVSKSDGIRHGSGSFSVPIEKYKDVSIVFKEMKITPRTIEIWIG